MVSHPRIPVPSESGSPLPVPVSCTPAPVSHEQTTPINANQLAMYDGKGTVKNDCIKYF